MESHVEMSFPVEVIVEGGQVVLVNKELGITAYGATKAEADDMFEVMVVECLKYQLNASNKTYQGEA